MNICVIIPAYNEAKTIGNIVELVKAKGLDVIVFDDGSVDGTGHIAASAGAILLTHKRNQGKGASMKEAFSFIIDKTTYDAVITMDADGQHDASDIGEFIDNYDKGDIILGNRMQSTKDMPKDRLYTNIYMSKFISFLCKQHVPDSQCGFRLIKRDVLKSVKLTSSNYDTETEILIKASRKHFKIYSVPVKTVYQGEISKIKPVKDTLRFFVMVVRSYFEK